MKRTARKWLSLLMALVMVLSLMPMALADGAGGEGESSENNSATTAGRSEGTDEGDSGSGPTPDSPYSSPGGNNEDTPPPTPVDPAPEHGAATEWTQGENNTHYHKCEVANCTEHLKYDEATCSASTWETKTAATCSAPGSEEGTCVCGRKLTREIPQLAHEYEYKVLAGGKHNQVCKNCQSVKADSEVSHTYGTDGECVCGAENTADAAAVVVSGSKITLDLSGTKTETISWVCKDADGNYTKDTSGVTFGSSDEDVADVNASGKVTAYGVGSATITIYFNKKKADTVSVTVKDSDAGNITVTIYSGTTYYLDETDDKGGKSVLDKIDDYIYSRDKGRLDEIKFTNVTDTVGDLDAGTKSWYDADEAADISFEPEKTGTATFDYRAASTKGNEYSGTISIKVEKGSASSGDIVYSQTAGKDVNFDAADFEDFWADNRKSSKESLDYVIFSLPSSSSGVLYEDDGTKLKSSSKCCADPSKTQIDLDGIYFEPKSSKAGTVKISFTAVGDKDNEYDGTVVITYLKGDIDDITYTAGTNGKVELKAKDFTDVYKEATGSSASSLTITFTSLPSNGTLTYGSKDTKVSKSTTFKTSGSGNKISDVTYTASGSKSDTITYTAASGSTKITGKIVFNAAAVNISLTVPYTCGAAGVTFSPADFTSRAAALGSSYTLAFGQPSGGNGGLYYTAIGSQIPAGTKIPVSTLNTVTYRPAMNGSTTIAFVIYDASGLVAGSGGVTITVSGMTADTTTTTTPANPSVTVNSFKDVEAGAWYRSDLSRLVDLGIVAGTTPTKFDPLGELNYGATLKLVCKAVGVTQAEGTGSQWAANYKSYAVSQGWCSDSVDLSAYITRTEVAQIVAKALGLTPSSAKPFTDSSDPYVAAANGAGIFLGNATGLFKGESTLRRNEICAVVCRMLDYRTNSFGSEKPGWL